MAITQVSWKRQLILAAGLFALGTAAYWLEYKHKPKKEAEEEQSKKIFQLKEIQVQSMKLIDGAHRFEMVCSDLASKLCKSGDQSKWELTEPLKLKADDSNVNSLVSTLNNLNVSETIDLKEETPEKRAALLKDYGLDPSTRTASARQVQVLTPSGGQVLYLGQTHPIGESIFAVVENVASGQKPSGKVDENRVYLVPSYFKSSFDHDLTYWRDKKIITLASHDIESFQLSGSKVSGLSAVRKDGQWNLKVKNEDLAGDIENVDSLLSAVTYLTAKGFISENKKDDKAKAALKGLPSSLTLVLQKGKGTEKEAPVPVTLILYSGASGKGGKDSKDKDGKLYATASNLDPLFELESSAKERLDKSLKDLRLSKLVTSMDRFSAKKLEFSGKPLGPSLLILAQTDGKWETQPDKKEVANDKVQDTLDKISGNRIKDFLQGSAIPTGEQDGIKLSLGDEKETKRQILFWKKGNDLYARDLGSKRNEAFLVDSAMKDALPWDRAFYDKKVEAPAPAPSPPKSP